MHEERNDIPQERLQLMVIRAEKYKSKAWPNIKTVYQILDEDCDKPVGYTQSLLRYIPSDHNDNFNIILN
jgi:hypothetical protein